MHVASKHIVFTGHKAIFQRERGGITFMSSTVNKKQKKGFELRDVILMASLGLLFAIIYLAVFNVGMAISTALTGTGLADFAFDIIYGVWFMAGTLAAYIIRKPGAGLVAEVLASVIELLLGNSGGVSVVITGVIQGLGTEAGFAIFRYKKWNMASMSLSAVLSGIFIYIYELFYLQYYMLSPMMHIGHLVIRSISGIVFSALICVLVGNGLAKTGVMKNYAIGANIKNVQIHDDEEEE